MCVFLHSPSPKPDVHEGIFVLWFFFMQASPKCLKKTRIKPKTTVACRNRPKTCQISICTGKGFAMTKPLPQYYNPPPVNIKRVHCSVIQSSGNIPDISRLVGFNASPTPYIFNLKQHCPFPVYPLITLSPASF